ncbi:MAG: LemA family protein [Gammaproteobacteria bacterium]|nr:LemA family protein [Gammaproteobacteria bacterium]
MKAHHPELILAFQRHQPSTPDTRPAHRLVRTWGLLLTLMSSVLLGGCGINNIPTFDEAVNGAWSEVQNQYKRRADLIPNLIETVKAYAKQEEDVLLQVVEARNKVSQMNVTPETLTDPAAFEQFQQNQGALSSALSRLLVVVESYPELKSNENFLALQSQLEGTENRIAVARRDYIQKVQRYNTELRTIPGRWWRRFMYPDSRIKENFSVANEDTELPKVNIN